MPLVIRPRLRKLLPVLLGALGFVAVGGYLIATGHVLEGLLSIGFFGGGAALVVGRAARHGMSQLTLAPDGLHLSTGGVIAWTGIEAVTHTSASGGMVGIRLRSPERFLSTVPPHTNRSMRRFMLPFAAVLGVLGARSLLRYARTVRTYADELRWNRDTFGWDVAFADVWLDRPGADFAALLEDHRRGFDGPGRR